MPLKAETEPITDDEFVLRLIWQDFFKSGIIPPVRPKAFEPKNTKKTQETEGISVWRVDCLPGLLDPLQTIREETRSKQYIVRLAVRDLFRLGLTVRPDPRTEPPPTPGHALIPELNTVAFEADRAKWERILEQLAELSSADIVHRPTEPGQ